VIPAREEVIVVGNNGSSGQGTASSDYDSSLPNNDAETQAARDSAKESMIEKSWSDTKAKDGADSLWSSIFGRK